MKDWKAAIRTWESNAKEKQTNVKSYQERRIAQQEKAGEEFLRGN